MSHYQVFIRHDTDATKLGTSFVQDICNGSMAPWSRQDHYQSKTRWNRNASGAIGECYAFVLRPSLRCIATIPVNGATIAPDENRNNGTRLLPVLLDGAIPPADLFAFRGTLDLSPGPHPGPAVNDRGDLELLWILARCHPIQVNPRCD